LAPVPGIVEKTGPAKKKSKGEIYFFFSFYVLRMREMFSWQGSNSAHVKRETNMVPYKKIYGLIVKEFLHGLMNHSLSM